MNELLSGIQLLAQSEEGQQAVTETLDAIELMGTTFGPRLVNMYARTTRACVEQLMEENFSREEAITIVTTAMQSFNRKK